MIQFNNKTTLFISKSKQVHGERYDYSKVVYVNAKTKVIIICKEHGDFFQTPSNHLSNFNCQKCAKNFKIDTLAFIEKAKKIHGERYDYSKANYTNANNPILIICKEHGEFNQIPDFHLNRKCNCPKCVKNIISDSFELIKNLPKNNENNFKKSPKNNEINLTHDILC
jgi:hypothetical protein